MPNVSIVPGKTFDLADGRVLRMMESGDLGGSPIVVFHPTPSSRLFARQHADAGLRTGVRLVGFSRPGSGGSTMTTPGLHVVAEDAIRVADTAGLDRFAVLGFSGGTPFAAATAALFPDRVRALGLCAAVAPWQQVQDRGVEFDEELAQLLELAAHDVDAAVAGLRRQGERVFAEQVALDDDDLAKVLLAEAMPPDEQVLTPALAASQAVTLHDALSDEDELPCYDTYAFDELAFGLPWDVDVRAVAAASWIWQGDRDVVTPLEHARWYAGQIPHASLVVREGRGHLGSFEAHRDEMLTTLRDAI